MCQPAFTQLLKSIVMLNNAAHTCEGKKHKTCITHDSSKTDVFRKGYIKDNIFICPTAVGPSIKCLCLEKSML